MICAARLRFMKSPCVWGARGGVMAFSLISRRKRCAWATELARGCFPVDCGGFAGFRQPGDVLAARRALCVRGAPLGIIAELPKRTCRAVFRA